MYDLFGFGEGGAQYQLMVQVKIRGFGLTITVNIQSHFAIQINTDVMCSYRLITYLYRYWLSDQVQKIKVNLQNIDTNKFAICAASQYFSNLCIHLDTFCNLIRTEKNLGHTIPLLLKYDRLNYFKSNYILPLSSFTLCLY